MAEITTTVANFSVTPPNQDDPDTFNDRMDTVLGEFPDIIDDVNEIVNYCKVGNIYDNHVLRCIVAMIKKPKHNTTLHKTLLIIQYYN